MSKTLKELEQDCDWSDKFHEYCKNKMIVGRQKYGRWKDNRVQVNIWASLEARWENYQKTGNRLSIFYKPKMNYKRQIGAFPSKAS